MITETSSITNETVNEITEWKREVKALFNEIKTQLLEYQERKQIHDLMIPVTEKRTKTYIINGLSVFGLNDSINIIPTARYISDGKGRVDVFKNDYRTMIIIKNNDNEWKIVKTVKNMPEILENREFAFHPKLFAKQITKKL